MVSILRHTNKDFCLFWTTVVYQLHQFNGCFTLHTSFA